MQYVELVTESELESDVLEMIWSEFFHLEMKKLSYKHNT